MKGVPRTCLIGLECGAEPQFALSCLGQEDDVSVALLPRAKGWSLDAYQGLVTISAHPLYMPIKMIGFEWRGSKLLPQIGDHCSFDNDKIPAA
jgi:hypothetical protein